MVVILGCSQVWLPISMPASATLRTGGIAATLLPIMKNVAFAPASLSTLTRRSVNGVGPSSKVRATHLSFARSRPALRGSGPDAPQPEKQRRGCGDSDEFRLDGTCRVYGSASG